MLQRKEQQEQLEVGENGQITLRFGSFFISSFLVQHETKRELWFRQPDLWSVSAGPALSLSVFIFARPSLAKRQAGRQAGRQALRQVSCGELNSRSYPLALLVQVQKYNYVSCLFVWVGFFHL